MKTLWLVAACAVAWLVHDQGWASEHDIEAAAAFGAVAWAFELHWKTKAMAAKIEALEQQAKKRAS